MNLEGSSPDLDAAQKKLAETPRDPLDTLAEQFIARCRAGERPTIAEYTGRRPDLAVQIATLFPTLLELETLGASGPEAPAGNSAAPPEVIGDFRILREVGHGGMGTVYEAEQVSLGRRVALKVMHAGRLGDQKVLERFRREARAAARLHHSNIVPVYGTGEVEGAVFYAMQFIDGRDLGEVIEEIRRQKEARPTGAQDARPVSDSAAALTGSSSTLLSETQAHYFRRVSGILRDAAQALAYAHGEGLLHRDIKPANLLLDAKGTIWITDFGLAKAEGSTQLTQSGDVVGTVAYLAPERLDGWCDARSDVYALGLTLYELLTLRRAFPQSTRAEILHAIARYDPTRPRKIDPAIPKDLETVVLKTIDKNPAFRYGSAQELAADLERFLEIRPIQARRSGKVSRLWRWCQRNPLTAWFAAASLMLLGAFLVGAMVAQLHLRRQREAASHAQSRADERMREVRIAAAQLRRQTGVAGQRIESLRELKEAAAVRSDEPVVTESIAALSLFDVEVERELPLGVRAVAFSATLKTYATEEAGGVVSVRDGGDGRVLQSIAPLEGQRDVDNMRFSRSGRFLAVGFNGRAGYEVRVSTASDGKEVLRGLAPGQGLGCDFSPDERSVAVRQRGGTVAIVSLADGDPAVDPGPARRMQLPPGWPETARLRFHPSGRWLAGVSPWMSRSIVVWDVETGRLDCILTMPDVPLCFAWHPSAKLLAVGCGDFNAYLWDVDSDQRVVEYTGHEAEVVEVEFHPEGHTLATGSWDGGSRFWDAWTGRQKLHTLGSFHLWDHSGERVVFVLGRRSAGIWRVSLGSEARLIAFETGAKGVRRLAVSPEGDVIAGAADAHGLQLGLSTGGLAQLLSPENITDVAFLANGRGLVAGGRRLLLFPIERNGETARFLSPRVLAVRGGYLGLAADDRHVAFRGEGERIMLLDLEGGAVARPLGPGGGVTDLEVSRGARWVAASGTQPHGRRVLDGTTGEEVLGFERSNVELAFSHDDRWLVASDSESTQLIEVGSWRRVWSRPRREGGDSHGSIAFPRDPRFVVATTSRSELALYDAAAGREVSRFAAQDSGAVGSIATGGPSTLAISLPMGLVQTWDLEAIQRGLATLRLDIELDVGSRSRESPARRIEGPEEHSEDAVAHRRQRRDAKDIATTLSRLAAARPDSADIFERRAEVFAAAGQRFDAALDLDRALKLKPKDPASTSLRRAQLLDRLQSFEPCLAEADRCLSYSPDLVGAIVLRAFALKNLVRLSEAALAFERVLKLSPFNTQAAEELAWLLCIGPEAARAPERALSLARLAVIASPKSLFAIRAQALAAYRTGAVDEARGAVQRILALPESQRSLTARIILALVEARSGDRDAAKRALEEARSMRLGATLAPYDVGPIDALLAEAEEAVK